MKDTNRKRIRKIEKKDLRKTPVAVISVILILAVFFIGSAIVLKETYTNIRFTKAIWNSHLPNVRYYIYEDFLKSNDIINIHYHNIPYYLGAEPDFVYEYTGENGDLHMDYIYTLGHGRGEKDDLYLVFRFKDKKMTSYETVTNYVESGAPAN